MDVGNLDEKTRKLLACKASVIELFGERMNGKSKAIIWDWIVHSNKHGSDAAGALFFLEQRIIRSTKHWLAQEFRSYFSNVEKSRDHYYMESGACLNFFYGRDLNDICSISGDEYTWAAFDNMPPFFSYGLPAQLLGYMRSAHGVERRLIICRTQTDQHQFIHFGR